MIRVVLDTNVLISGILGIRLPNSTPGELIRRWRGQGFTLLLSEHILAETERTLAKPFFQRSLNPAQAASAVHLLRRKAELVTITTTVANVATHPEDDIVVSTAVAANARYLVTGDAKLQEIRRYRGVTILSPRAFLSLLEQEEVAG